MMSIPVRLPGFMFLLRGLCPETPLTETPWIETPCIVKSGWYASYWNAFLWLWLLLYLANLINRINFMKFRLISARVLHKINQWLWQ